MTLSFTWNLTFLRFSLARCPVKNSSSSFCAARCLPLNVRHSSTWLASMWIFIWIHARFSYSWFTALILKNNNFQTSILGKMTALQNGDGEATGYLLNAMNAGRVDILCSLLHELSEYRYLLFINVLQKPKKTSNWFSKHMSTRLVICCTMLYI